jgi:hypothetical protein
MARKMNALAVQRQRTHHERERATREGGPLSRTDNVVVA